MGKKLSEWLHRISREWVALAALAVFVVFTALFLPGQGTQTDQYGHEIGIPDLSMAYSPSDLYALAEAYGPEGRVAYIRARFTFDVIWPVVYTLFLVTAMSWSARRAFAADSRWQRANLVPLLAALFDYLENTATSLVMARYPARAPVVAALATLFTPLKWLFVAASVALLLICVCMAARRRFERAR